MDIWSIALRRNTHPIESARAAEGLVDAPGDVRQAWLADVIAAKGAIPGATVEWVRRIPPGKQGGSSRRK